VSPAPKPSELRASDADRERVVALLADAASDGRLTLDEHTERVQRAYQARTLGELAGLTRDLVAPGSQPLQLDDSRSVAVFFSSTRREGRWVVPDRLSVTAVGGQVVLDLREAILQNRNTILHATLVGGRLDLLIPDGVNVVVTSSRYSSRVAADLSPRPGQSAQPGQEGTPEIEVRTFSVAGRVRVHTPRRPGWRGRFARPR
jgi:hypothetical protein